MFESKPSYDAYFLPGPSPELTTEDSVVLGVEWLLAQPGSPLIVVSAKGNVSNSRALEEAVQRSKLPVAAPPSLRRARWRGPGSILAPWAMDKALFAIDGDLRDVNAVCLLHWHEGDHDAWVLGHGARDLRDPSGPVPAPELPPVVAGAMQEASDAINHNNGLVQYEDKAYVVRTLQELVRNGYTFDLDHLVGWAIAEGWHSDELPRLREYAEKVMAGRRFQLKDPWGPRPGAHKRWAQEYGG